MSKTKLYTGLVVTGFVITIWLLTPAAHIIFRSAWTYLDLRRNVTFNEAHLNQIVEQVRLKLPEGVNHQEMRLDDPTNPRSLRLMKSNEAISGSTVGRVYAWVTSEKKWI